MTPIKKTAVITVQDPREFDGDPYQVSVRAIQQVRGLIALATDVLEPTTLMVRNADLERELAFGNELGNAGKDWPESPQGRQLLIIAKQLEDAEARLARLEKATAFNPKAR